MGEGETPTADLGLTAEQPYFRPFVGQQYDAHPALPGRLLVLGESHYLRKPEDDTPDFTIRLLQSVAADHMMPGWRTRYFKNLFFLLTGERNRSVSQDRWKGFWNSLAFYNYCQTRRLTRPLMRPTPQEWESAREPFRTVLAKLRPDFVLVTGYQVSGHATALSASVATADNDGIWLPLSGAGYALARGIYHPSSRQFRHDPEQVRTIVQRFLRSERLTGRPIVVGAISAAN